MNLDKELFDKSEKEEEENQTACLVGINASKQIALSIVDKNGATFITTTMNAAYAKYLRDLIDSCINKLKKPNEGSVETDDKSVQ